MADINRCIFTGRLGADPELRTTASGISTCSFSLAVSRSKAKEAKEAETDWLPMVAWRHTAEFITRFLTRGRKVTVEAEARMRQWTGKDGKTHKAIEFQVVEIFRSDGRRARDKCCGDHRRRAGCATQKRIGEWRTLPARLILRRRRKNVHRGGQHDGRGLGAGVHESSRLYQMAFEGG